MSTIHQSVPFEDKQFWLASVLADTTLTPGAKVAATAIYLHHNTKTGRCDPGYSTLATTAGTKKPTIQTAIKRLVSAGYVAVTPATATKSTVYRLTLPAEISRSSLTKADRPAAFPRPNGMSGNTPGMLGDTPGMSGNTGGYAGTYRGYVGEYREYVGTYQTGKEQGMNREEELGMNREENNDSERGGARSASPRSAPAAFVMDNSPAKIIPFPVRPSQTPPAVPSLQTPPADPPPAAMPAYNLQSLSAWMDRIENPDAHPQASFKNIFEAHQYGPAMDIEAEITAIMCGA